MKDKGVAPGAFVSGGSLTGLVKPKKLQGEKRERERERGIYTHIFLELRAIYAVPTDLCLIITAKTSEYSSSSSQVRDRDRTPGDQTENPKPSKTGRNREAQGPTPPQKPRENDQQGRKEHLTCSCRYWPKLTTSVIHGFELIKC